MLIWCITGNAGSWKGTENQDDWASAASIVTILFLTCHFLIHQLCASAILIYLKNKCWSLGKSLGSCVCFLVFISDLMFPFMHWMGIYLAAFLLYFITNSCRHFIFLHNMLLFCFMFCYYVYWQHIAKQHGWIIKANYPLGTVKLYNNVHVFKSNK